MTKNVINIIVINIFLWSKDSIFFKSLLFFFKKKNITKIIIANENNLLKKNVDSISNKNTPNFFLIFRQKQVNKNIYTLAKFLSAVEIK